MLPYFLCGQLHYCTWQLGHSLSVFQDMRTFSDKAFTHQEPLRGKEISGEPACSLCEPWFSLASKVTAEIQDEDQSRALSVKVSSIVMRHALFSFGLLSPLWHPRTLVKKKALRARAQLAQRTVSRVCWSRWIKSIFSLSEGGNAAQSSMPKAPLKYLGWNCLYLSITSPWTDFRLQLQKQNKAKLSIGTGGDTASSASSFTYSS